MISVRVDQQQGSVSTHANRTEVGLVAVVRVGGRDVDLDDVAAVQALTQEEFAELLAAAVAADRADPCAETADLPVREVGRGSAMLLPTLSPRL